MPPRLNPPRAKAGLSGGMKEDGGALKAQPVQAEPSTKRNKSREGAPGLPQERIYICRKFSVFDAGVLGEPAVACLREVGAKHAIKVVRSVWRRRGVERGRYLRCMFGKTRG